ncbi:hypothetical protein LUB13_07725, partial [Lactobacillus delbrueckii subsp. lactis]|uniref:hypothetical protein n=1 Tax=Lactobacillus delbrueckii TaxID=1584 RepID=UPI001E2A7782
MLFGKNKEEKGGLGRKRKFLSKNLAKRLEFLSHFCIINKCRLTKVSRSPLGSLAQLAEHRTLNPGVQG